MNNLLFIIILIIILLIILLIDKDKDTFINSDILLENPDNNIKTIDVINRQTDTEIPLNIFMTWYTKDLTTNMKDSIEEIKSNNPEFNFYIYDDEDCRNFLKKYFVNDVVNAFDSLIPGAYKADLWRYCVLYYYGGIYVDIKYKSINNFKFIELTDKEYLIKDRLIGGGGIYNGLLILKEGNTILYNCIKKVIKNVRNKYYGLTPLHPTGPMLMKEFVSKDKLSNSLKYEQHLSFDFIDGIGLIFDKMVTTDYIIKNNKKILKSYNTYRKDQKKSKTPHYTKLFFNKKIYV